MDKTETMTPEQYRSEAEPTEHEEQCRVIKWAKTMAMAGRGEYSLLFAIPNGGARNAAVGGKLKAEGVKRGVPDLCLPVPKGEYHGLYIEMKKRRGGRVRKHQKQWIKRLRKQGYAAHVCRGADHAIDTIAEYLEG